MPFRVDVAEPGDIAALNTLIERSTRVLAAGYYSAEQIESAIRHVFHVDEQLVRDRTYFVVRSGDAIAGCGGWSRRAALFHTSADAHSEDRLALDPARDAARIRAMFTAPEFARQGVGRLLLDVGLDAARAEGFARVELMATLPGVPLYTVYGFRELAREQATLPDGVVMEFVRMGRSTAGGGSSGANSRF